MTERAYGWDEPEIPEPNEGGEYTLLPAGTYPFLVVKFERSRHEPKPGTTGKIKTACNKAVITIKVDGGEHGETTIKENLFLHSSCEGILCSFFASIGHRQHGQPLTMKWDRVVGSEGWCRVKQVPGKNDGKVFNNIERWCDPPESASTPADGLEF